MPFAVNVVRGRIDVPNSEFFRADNSLLPVPNGLSKSIKICLEWPKSFARITSSSLLMSIKRTPYSSQVILRLAIAEQTIALAQVGPDFFVLRDLPPVSQLPGNGRVDVIIQSLRSFLWRRNLSKSRFQGCSQICVRQHGNPRLIDRQRNRRIPVMQSPNSSHAVLIKCKITTD